MQQNEKAHVRKIVATLIFLQVHSLEHHRKVEICRVRQWLKHLIVRKNDHYLLKFQSCSLGRPTALWMISQTIPTNTSLQQFWHIYMFMWQINCYYGDIMFSLGDAVLSSNIINLDYFLLLNAL